MRSSQNVAIVKIPFHLRAMAFLIIAYCFCSHEKGGFAIGNSGTQLAAVVLGILRRYMMSKRSLVRKYTHCMITFVVSVMASNTVNGL